MAEMMIEMYILDQYAYDFPDLLPIADTTLVYEAIFNKYGYNTRTFHRSLARHLQKPDKLKKAFALHREQIALRRSALQKALDHAAKVAEMGDELPFRFALLPLHLHKFTPYVDSVALWRLDSIVWWKPDTTRFSMFSTMSN